MKFKTEFPSMVNRIKWALELRDMKMRDLAYKVGTTDSNLHHMLKKSNPAVCNLTKIAEILEVHPGWFWEAEKDFKKAFENYQL